MIKIKAKQNPRGRRLQHDPSTNCRAPNALQPQHQDPIHSRIHYRTQEMDYLKKQRGPAYVIYYSNCMFSPRDYDFLLLLLPEVPPGRQDSGTGKCRSLSSNKIIHLVLCKLTSGRHKEFPIGQANQCFDLK